MKSDDIDRMIEEMSKKHVHESDKYRHEPWVKTNHTQNITNIPKMTVTLKDIQKAVNALERRINK